MSAVLAHHWWISPEEYLQGEELAKTKHEYVGGVVYAMTGAKNRHNLIAGSIFLEVGSLLRGHRCQPFNSDTKVRLQHGDDVRFYYPDCMVVCEPNDLDEVFQDRPTVIFEVLPDSTARTDREEKLRAYQTISSLRLCAIVESERRGVTCHRRLDEGAPWTTEFVQTPGAVISLPTIGCAVSLEAMYARSGL